MQFVAKLTIILVGFASARTRSALPPDETDRLAHVAEDIWSVVDASDDDLFAGEAGKEMSALLLAATAAQETGLERKYQTCEGCPIGGKRCDGGRSVTLYQLHQGRFAWGNYSRDELCSDNALATERAYHVMLAHRRHMASVPGLVCAYQGVRTLSAAAREKLKYFELFSRSAGIRTHSNRHGLTAYWRPGSEPNFDEDETDLPAWWNFEPPTYAKSPLRI